MKGKVFSHANNQRKANYIKNEGAPSSQAASGDRPLGKGAGIGTKKHIAVTPLDSVISLPGMYPEEIIHKRENHKHLKVFIAAPSLPEHVSPPAMLFVIIKTMVRRTNASL